jgi:Family of unknown function (DUF6789)
MTFNISKILKGMVAGFAGTIVLSILMKIKMSTGVMPELNPIRMLATIASEKTGGPVNLLVGWVMHFVLGSVIWGGLFAILNNILPSKNQIIKGMSLATVAWLLMMVGAMPMSGAGLFGTKISVMVPVMTLVFHFALGATMGKVFALLGGAKEIRREE